MPECHEYMDADDKRRVRMQLVAYFAAVVVPYAICGCLLAYLEVNRPGGDWNANTTAMIVAGATAVTTQLVVLIRSIYNGQAINQVDRKADVAVVNAERAAARAEEAVEVVKKHNGY